MLSTILERLVKALAEQGKRSTNECVRQLADWIDAGSWDEAYLANPIETLACTAEAVCFLVGLWMGKLHDHGDDAAPRAFYAVSESIDEETESAVRALAASLGVTEPMMTEAGASAGVLDTIAIKIVVAALIKYLGSKYPALVPILEAILAGL